MENSLFTQRPDVLRGKCIICHKEDAELTDEHIIPKSLGGYMHSWHVCKDCNSKFGEKVDTYLTSNLLIQFARNKYQLKGQSGQAVPSPLEGVATDDSGKKYRVAASEDGKLTPHLFPSKPVLSEDGKSISVSADITDAAKIHDMIVKYCKRNGIDYSKLATQRKEVRQEPSPLLHYSFTIDIYRFRLPLLKIAYEFCAELIPDYVNDPSAIRVSQILQDANIDELKELNYIGDGMHDIISLPFKNQVDFDNPHRHYIILQNEFGKLFCFVRLFNIISIGIQMSEHEYPLPNDMVIAINDFEKKSVDIYNLEELSQKSSGKQDIFAVFPKEWNKFLQECPIKMSFYAGKDGYNICYQSNGKPIGTLPQLMAQWTNIDDMYEGNDFVVTYHVNGEFFFLLSPFNKLVPVEKIIMRTEMKKI